MKRSSNTSAAIGNREKSGEVMKKIDHIAIAVGNLEESITLFEQIFGLELAHRESIAGYEVDTATFRVGDTEIELVEGKGEGSPIWKFIESRGPGIHHIAFAVEDIEETLAALRAKGLGVIDEAPRRGKEGSRVAFLNPRTTLRILIELVQRKRED